MSNQAGQGIKTALSEHTNVGMVFKGILVSYIITLPAFMVFALILTYTDFPEKLISTVVLITTVISIMIAGSVATRNVKNKGWLNGSMVGIVYILILYLASSLAFKNFSVDIHVLTMLLAGILAGAIGGIMGINVKKPKHQKYKR